MLKVGDYVTRKKYNHDILFRIKKIEDNKIILSGVDLRLYADAHKNDLVLATISKKKEIHYITRSLNIKEYFYIPGTILHLDSDIDYLNKCLEYYKQENIKCNGFNFEEKEYENKIITLLEKYKPNIVVITGHDAYYKEKNKYKNSEYFINTVKKAKNYKNDLIIVSGACQSDFNGLIKSGSTFASSPSHINIHALDPAIIASYIAKTDKSEFINLEDILSKTKYGKDGIGGLKINGVMYTGAPRKEQK